MRRALRCVWPAAPPARAPYARVDHALPLGCRGARRRAPLDRGFACGCQRGGLAAGSLHCFRGVGLLGCWLVSWRFRGAALEGLGGFQGFLLAFGGWQGRRGWLRGRKPRGCHSRAACLLPRDLIQPPLQVAPAPHAPLGTAKRWSVVKAAAPGTTLRVFEREHCQRCKQCSRLAPGSRPTKAAPPTCCRISSCPSSAT